MSERDPDGTRLPIRIDETSNGEFLPQALEPRNKVANELAHTQAGENARRLGLARRGFMMSVCGAASTLLAVNEVNASAGKRGGVFALPKEAALDSDAASAFLGGREFIFDVQGHYVNPEGAWLKKSSDRYRPMYSRRNACVRDSTAENREYLKCLGAEEFIKDVFLDSDTDMMVLTFLPSRRGVEPLTIEEADETRRIVDAMDGNHRVMIHGRVSPNQPGDLEDMDRLAEEFPISAWKTFTQWGPKGVGFSLTDDVGEAFIAKAKALGIKNICMHKGFPLSRRSIEHSTCHDVGEAARRHPDINFIIYHCGYDVSVKEGHFTPGAGAARGADVLCQSLIDAGVKPGSNVYAELGSTWRFVMRDPDQAAHLLGKIHKYCGPDNILWGTDSIWYGSPQDQIQAFRTFQISEEFREKYGYPELTPDLKAKIFGLNATVPYKITPEEVLQRASRDTLSKRRQAYLERPDPSFTTYGPKTRTEFLNLLRNSGGH